MAMPKKMFSRRKGRLLLAFAAVSMLLGSACSSLKPAPSAAKIPQIRRGWSYIETSAETAKLEAGSPPLNFSGAAIEGKYLFFGTQRFGLVALDKNTGRVVWRAAIPEGASNTVLARGEKVFVGGFDGKFRAYSLAGGQMLWETDLKFPPSGTPAIADGRILVGSEDHAVHALDIATGKLLWSYRRGTTGAATIRGGGSPAFIGGKFWVGFADGTFVALQPQDGSVVLERQFLDNTKFMDVDAAPISWKKGILATSYEGRLRFLQPDGSLLWSFPAGSARSPLVTNVAGGRIFVASSDGYIYALSDDNGKEIWKFAVRKGNPTGLGVFQEKSDPLLAVASSDNFIYLLNAVSGQALERLSIGSSSGSYTDLVVDPENKNRFFMVSHFGRVHEFTVR